MKKGLNYSILSIMLMCSCSKATGEKEYEPKTEVKTQEEDTLAVVPIPDDARDPIIDRYIQFMFGRGVNEPNDSGDTPLLEAVKKGDEQSRIVLLEHPGVNLNASDEYGKTALHSMVMFGKEKVVAELLAKGADPNYETKFGYNALHQAAMRDNVAIVKMLLDNGADVNSSYESGWTALHHAVSCQRASNVTLLLERGAKINAKTIYRDTALRFAIMRGDIAIVKMLLDHGADVNGSGLKPSVLELASCIEQAAKKRQMRSLLSEHQRLAK